MGRASTVLWAPGPPRPAGMAGVGSATPVQRAIVGIIARPFLGHGTFTLDDYDLLTLPWRCRVGSLHPGDDNDVCGDPLVEMAARRFERAQPGLDRPAYRDAARVEMALRAHQSA